MQSDRVLLILFTNSCRYGFGEPLKVFGYCAEADARKICSDPRTAGRTWFVGWARERGQKRVPMRDDGRLRTVVEDLGVVIEWLAR